jgi:hypothetical protein
LNASLVGANKVTLAVVELSSRRFPEATSAALMSENSVLYSRASPMVEGLTGNITLKREACRGQL